MLSKEQRAILTAREIVLKTVDTDKGTLAERLHLAARDIKILSAAMGIWVDKVAVQYRDMGCTQEEWQEDIRTWFASQQFYIDDDVNDGSMLRCHLSNTGWGRHVILSFSLGQPNTRRKK